MQAFAAAPALLCPGMTVATVDGEAVRLIAPGARSWVVERKSGDRLAISLDRIVGRVVFRGDHLRAVA